MLLFRFESEGEKGREDFFLKTSGERKREKETLDRTNNVGLIRFWYSLFFTITLQMFICFVLVLLQLNLLMDAGIIHADIAPKFTVAVAVKDEDLTLTIFSNQLTCKYCSYVTEIHLCFTKKENE